MSDPTPIPAPLPTPAPPPVSSAFPVPAQLDYPTAPRSWNDRADTSPTVAAPPPVVADPSLAPELVATPPRRNRTKLFLVAGGAVAIAAVAIVAIAMRGGDDAPAPKPAPPPQAAVAPPSPPPPAPPPEPPRATEPEPVADHPAADATKRPTAAKPPTLGGKRVVIEYDNAATHHAEAAKAPTPDDEPAIAKARVMYNVGNQRLFAGDAAGAVKAYRSALDNFSGYVAGYRGLGLAYMQLGNNAEALKALQTYVRAAPNAKDVALIKKRIAHLQSH